MIRADRRVSGAGFRPCRFDGNVRKSASAGITGKEKAPEGITVVGGKTGTTGAAGYCLVLYSYNASGQPIVSIVLKADGKSNLYLLMNEMLSGFAN